MLLGIFHGMLGGTVNILVLMFLYLVPTLIAAARHRQNRIAICNLNLLLGWTLIGWIVAIVWSLSRDAAIVTPSAPAAAQSEIPIPLREVTHALSTVAVQSGKDWCR